MVVAKQVKNTVDQKLKQPLFDGQTGFYGLGSAGVGRDYNVSQQVGVNLRKRPFPHSKGNDVCWPLTVQIGSIEI